MAYEVSLTEDAVSFIEEHVKRESVYLRIIECMKMLADYPFMGRFYDPEYPVVRLPFACRRLAVPDTPFALYYVSNEEERRLVVFYIEFATGNPNKRFKLI